MRHDPPEYSLVAACLSGPAFPVAPVCDWDRFVAIAAREEVLPAIHGKFPYPPDVANFLDGVYEINSTRNRQLLAELQQLALLLNHIGIVPVLLKGAAYLASGVYPDVGSRLLADIDLLVPADQSLQAFERIVKAGYEPCDENPASLVAHHHPGLVKAHHLPVEIHHSLGQSNCDRILNAREVIDASIPFRLGLARVRLPSAEHLMTHLILHSQLQHGMYFRIWPTLRSMLDLVRIHSLLQPNWNDVRERFARDGKSALLNVHLLQTERALGFPPPFSIPNGGLRWLYRRILWREKRLKYVDPFYTSSRLVLQRMSLTRRLWKHPLGRRRVLSTPFRRSFYRTVWNELRRG